MQRLSPETLFKPTAYSQVVVTSGRRMVFIAGQVSNDAQGNLVAAGDFARHSTPVFANLGDALTHAAVPPGDVSEITVYLHCTLPAVPPGCGGAAATLLPLPER